MIQTESSGWMDLLEGGWLSSLWLLERGESAGALDFHGAFIPEVAEGILRRWSKPGDWVWDPMAGSGTTGQKAVELGRHCLLSDISPRLPEIYEADATTALPWARKLSIDGKSHLTPSLECPMPQDADPFQFDLIVLHPPYYNTIQFSEDPSALENGDGIKNFLCRWEDAVWNVVYHLEEGGYLVIVCGDVWITREQARKTGDPYGHCPLASAVFNRAVHMMSTRGGDRRTPVLKAHVVKNIEGNRARAGRRHLDAARFTKLGAVFFETEEIFAIQWERR